MYRFNLELLELLHYHQDLNTTNVSVQFTNNITRDLQMDRFKYNKCIGSIHINVTVDSSLKGFKYNKCIGSIYRNS